MGSSPRGSAHEDLFGAMDRAAIDPKAWLDVCDGLAAVVGGAGTMFVPLRSRPGRQAVPILPGWRSPSKPIYPLGRTATIEAIAGFQ